MHLHIVEHQKPSRTYHILMLMNSEEKSKLNFKKFITRGLRLSVFLQLSPLSHALFSLFSEIVSLKYQLWAAVHFVLKNALNSEHTQCTVDFFISSTFHFSLLLFFLFGFFGEFTQLIGHSSGNLYPLFHLKRG